MLPRCVSVADSLVVYCAIVRALLSFERYFARLPAPVTMVNCEKCLDDAVRWEPDLKVKLKGKSVARPPITSCAPRAGTDSVKCRNCASNNKPCDPLPRFAVPTLRALIALQSVNYPSKAAYVNNDAVKLARAAGRRVLRRIRRGDPGQRARAAAAAALVAEQREASDAAAEARLVARTSLEVQIEISNNLRAIAAQISTAALAARVGPVTMPNELKDPVVDASDASDAEDEGDDDDDA
ncbi:hypothetical protein ACHAPT_008480 [Fusarium lateritium]